ncbi:MAG: hypothetical protein Q8L57_02360 [bacterium]|nr:hypothetical protein [bacterium]
MTNSGVLAESKLLIAKLREDPISARLTDYALKCGITLLVHPDSEKMVQEGWNSWMFFCFPGIKEFFIFIPFDQRRNIILPRVVNHQIFHFAHELGHYKSKEFCCRPVQNCQIWRRRSLNDHLDICLFKELFANLEAAEILKRTAKAALKNHGWQMVFLNLWRQCSECLKEINKGGCPQRKLIAKALKVLARKIKICQRDIERQMREK